MFRRVKVETRSYSKYPRTASQQILKYKKKLFLELKAPLGMAKAEKMIPSNRSTVLG